ncbi:hypothetical protein EV196_106234 [Mariniflexile fucanivorans]|uniref:Uncharacterized protein n=1 Tax=Mariniflexile fucanivorans TaxID=264023 RepID=A0A4R1RGD5_9FLAO|nr:hypothetical protein [Mariniflexile fucanivorans]TCL65043.1 hypothetical protein EV196_106234 [Mariniflexile fucanivorans]
MLNFILIAVGAIVLTIVLVKLVDKFIPSKFKPVLNIALWLLIAFLGYQTYMSIYTPILFNQEKDKRYAEVIKNLIDIRDSQLAYKQVNGKFTDNYDELVKFIENGQYTIIQRKDASIIDTELTKRFGVDTYKDIVIVDTLGFVPVKDSLFKNSTRYKTMMNVPVGKPDEKFKLEAGFIRQNDINIPVFEASVKKDIILYDQDKDMVTQENQVISVDGVNGDALRVGSMSEVKTIGNWPKTYGSNE